MSSAIDDFLGNTQQEDADDDDDRSWQLNPEISAMTRETEDLLDEIKQVGVPTPSNGLRYESDDDASLQDEIKGLDTAADEMREVMAMEQELRQRRKAKESELHSSVAGLSASKPEMKVQEVSEDEQLMIYATVVWAVLILLAVYVRYMILDENGHFRSFF